MSLQVNQQRPFNLLLLGTVCALNNNVEEAEVEWFDEHL